MEKLQCPICGKRVFITQDVSKEHLAAKAALCANEYTAHVGFILYKFIDVSELEEAPKEPILN